MTFVRHELVQFTDGSFSFVTANFGCPPNLGPDEVLRELIAHEQFGDTYAAQDSHLDTAPTIHGPDRRECVQPPVFDRLKRATWIRIGHRLSNAAVITTGHNDWR